MAISRLVFSHSRDLDGIVSAALMARCLRDLKLALVDYGDISRLIEGLKAAGERGIGEIYVADLALAEFYADIVLKAAGEAIERGISIMWFDHHRPPAELVEEASRLGIVMRLDQSRCSGEIISEALCGDPENALAKLAHDTDFLIFNHPLSKPLAELVTYYYHRGEEWRLIRLAERMAQGVIWDETIEEDWRNARGAIEEEEGRLLSRVMLRDPKGYRVAGSYASTLIPTHTGPLLLVEKMDADLGLVLYETGEFIVAKRRGVTLDCGALARGVGGGGHPHMAGGWFKDGGSLEERLRKLLNIMAEVIKNLS